MAKKHIKKNIKKTLEDKKASVLKTEPKKGNKTPITVIGIAVIVLAFVGFILFYGGSGKIKTVEAEAGIVKVPIAEISDGRAHFYKFNGSRGEIKFFVLKSSDGVIRAAFDACDVCFQEKKGYRQEGDFMVCINCEQRFESVNVNVIRGGCNPAPLDRMIQGDYLVLKVSDFESGKIYF